MLIDFNLSKCWILLSLDRNLELDKIRHFTHFDIFLIYFLYFSKVLNIAL